jgi:threonine synthase
VLCPADLEPEKLVATAIFGPRIFAVEGSYDDCSRLTVELSFELDWAFVNVSLRSYYAEGSKTLGFEIAEQLGWTLPDAVVAPVASGSMFTKVHQAFAELRELGLVDTEQPRFYGGQAEGCSPVAHAFESGEKLKPVRPNTIARSLAIGNPADGHYAIQTIKGSGGWSEDISDPEVIDAIRLLAETEGIFTETAGGVTVGTAGKLYRQDRILPEETTVLCVTGNGLKTTDVLAGVYQTERPIAPKLTEFEAYLQQTLDLEEVPGAIAAAEQVESIGA